MVIKKTTECPFILKHTGRIIEYFVLFLYDKARVFDNQTERGTQSRKVAEKINRDSTK